MPSRTLSTPDALSSQGSVNNNLALISQELDREKQEDGGETTMATPCDYSLQPIPVNQNSKLINQTRGFKYDICVGQLLTRTDLERHRHIHPQFKKRFLRPKELPKHIAGHNFQKC